MSPDSYERAIKDATHAEEKSDLDTDGEEARKARILKLHHASNQSRTVPTVGVCFHDLLNVDERVKGKRSLLLSFHTKDVVICHCS